MAASNPGADARIAPVPVPDDPVSTARELGVDLQLDLDQYVMRFHLAAADLAGAARKSLSRWARLVELCRLPDWPLVSMSIEERTGPVPQDVGPTSSVASRPPRAEIGRGGPRLRNPTSDFETIRSLPTTELLEGLIGPATKAPGIGCLGPDARDEAPRRRRRTRPI